MHYHYFSEVVPSVWETMRYKWYWKSHLEGPKNFRNEKMTWVPTYNRKYSCNRTTDLRSVFRWRGHLHIFKRHFFQKSFIKKSQFRYTTLCLKLRYFNENIFYHLLIKFAAQVISCLLSERDQLNSRLDRNHQNVNYFKSPFSRWHFHCWKIIMIDWIDIVI